MDLLRVRDAMVPSVQHVKLEARPSNLSTETTLFAVFDGPDDKPDLVGLVSIRQVARFPNRIFADLLPSRKRHAIGPDESVEAAIRQIEADKLDALAVVENGAFIGAVTRESIFSALLLKEQELAKALRQKEEQLRAILTSIPDIVFCFDEQGTFLAAFTPSRRRPELTSSSPSSPRSTPTTAQGSGSSSPTTSSRRSAGGSWSRTPRGAARRFMSSSRRRTRPRSSLPSR
jgi:hypothetical protein